MHHDRSDDNVQKYKAAKKKAKKAVSEARDKVYEEIYQKLSTKEGEKDVYKMAIFEKGRREISTKLNASKTTLIDCW